jgi:hypothetical protein
MIYTITTGVLTTDDGEVILEDCYAGGFAGQVPGAVNNPAACFTAMTGPLPPGSYDIGPLLHHPELGPAMKLTPSPKNKMMGRGGFYIHSNNRARDAGLPPYPNTPGKNSSDGCIVVTVPGGLDAVEARRASGDNQLEVRP